VPEPVEREVVAEYGRAALQNAQDIIGDARLLLDHGRKPRACALAVLAREEAAKAIVCCILPMLPDEAIEHFAWPFAQINRTHSLKLEMAGVIAHVLEFFMGGPDAPSRYPSELEVLAADAKTDNSRKQQGFYVGFQDGKILLPSGLSDQDAITEIERAAAIIAIAVQFLEFTSDLPDEFLAVREGFWDSMIKAWQQGGPDGMAELSQSMFGGLPEEDIVQIRARITDMITGTVAEEES
jgi:AbiV family abortive infection protein